MEFWGDDRGQSVQVGAILLFGILIVLLATIQTTVIPGQNAAVEFDHSRAVQSDMQDLRIDLLRASEGTGTATRVDLGTTYPNRLFFVNPPPATGRLRTVHGEDPALNVTLANSSGNVTVGSDYENAQEYWESSEGAGVFNTSHIVYTPDYAQYDMPPTTVYENSLLYNQFSNGANRTLSGQQLVQGTTVNLLAIKGNLQASGAGAKTVDVTTISETARTVTVRSEIGDPLYINITSDLPASRWNDADLLGAQPRATAVDAGIVPVDGETFHRVAIRLDEGETYQLRTGAVGVGAIPEDEIIPEPAYLVVTEEYETVADNETGSMTVEVRDRYNNPVTGAQVNVSTDGRFLEVRNNTQGWSDNASFETNSEGRAEITYQGNETTAAGESGWLNASIGGRVYEYRNVTGIEVPEVNAGGDNGGEINPGTTGELVQTSAILDAGNVDISFNNTDDGAITVTAVRLNFYYHFNNPGQGGGGGGGGGQPPTQADVTWNGSEANAVDIGGNYVEFDSSVTVPVTNEPTATVNFDEDAEQQDFFVLTLVYQIDGETERTTYFVSPENP